MQCDGCVPTVEKLDVNLLVIDHHDSFTYNLVDIIAQSTINRPTVIPADLAKSWSDLLHNQLQSSNVDVIDGIILSPGPGHPEDQMSSLSRDCVRQNYNLPILGVCLGHQILGTVYGAKVDLAPEPVHGQVWNIRFLDDNIQSDPLWGNVNDNEDGHVMVTRYHSLHVSQLDGTNLLATAVTDDSSSVLMSMRHRKYPHFGVQFHPESIGTNKIGKQLLQNFVQICKHRKNKIANKLDIPTVQKVRPKPTQLPSQQYVYIHKVPNLPPNGANMQPIDVMNDILCNRSYIFWLDEARAVHEVNPGISILGAGGRRVEYWGKDKEPDRQGLLVWDSNDDLVYKNQSMNILTYLYDQHQRITEHVTFVNFTESTTLEHRMEDTVTNTLPFHFRGGHVGYFGYELRYDTQHSIKRVGSTSSDTLLSSTTSASTVPTAALLWADKSFIYDHNTHDWYLVCVHTTLNESDTFEKTPYCDWMKSMSARLSAGLKVRNEMSTRKRNIKGMYKTPRFTPNRSRDCYNRNFEQCMEYIRQGESYELCLTNQLESQVPATSATSPLSLYNILRQRNPAPFSAFFHWNPNQHDTSLTSTSAVAICCTSPERFISVKRKQSALDGRANTSPKWEVEAKPIKGTMRRIVPSDGPMLTQQEIIQDSELAQKLQTSVKDRAENLMIVDLLRNDLSQVCETGSVHVSKLMDIESFATVHQMVSTILGTLNADKNAIDVIKVCFPGGSMTGAPKIRTMELLHEIENQVSRGPYSGCLGYISLNGCMDMNIIIRTAILTPECEPSTLKTNSNRTNKVWKVSIGAGGAITALSQPTDEYNEMMLKASAIIGAVEEWASVLDEDTATNTDILYDPQIVDDYLRVNATTPMLSIKNK
jgi:para-aminobenzoate synthetase